MKRTHAISDKLRAILWSAILSSLIAGIGAGVWTVLIGTNLMTTPAIPWAIVIMALILWIMWRYMGGMGWPRSTSDKRRRYLRANLVSWHVFAWTLTAGAVSLVALAGYWILLVELTGVGGNPTIPNRAEYPPLMVALGLLMGSIVSPVTEESAFRGYGQVILERVFPAAVSITLTSILFALWHGPTQGFYWSKLFFYFSVGVTFGSIAYLTNSSLPAIPVHFAGDMTFFFLIWPYDAARPLVFRDGTDISFWFAAAIALTFTALAILAFKHLASVTKDMRVTGTGHSGP